ncbi:unnamed protein product [Chironomus riparius]|uniref:Uncharacterized protein n=1 Tax=Chironomus riparius TaxID=315576 RepID=A0A9N9S8U8_9DIPT|nr:unnamed protein product [Chironomus riparius]
MRCSICKGTNCQKGDDCKRRINRSNMCRYILIILGVLFMAAGIWTLFESINTGSSTVDTLNVDNSNETLSHPGIEDENRVISPLEICIAVVGSILLITGLVFLITGVSKKRKLFPQGDGEEMQSFDSKIDLDRQVSFDQSPESSSRVYKKARYSSECDEDARIVKRNVYLELEKSPNGSDLEDDPELIPLNNENSLVLFPAEYPKKICTDEILQVVHNLVHASGLNLRTKYMSLEDDYIKITHLVISTREYFQRTDPNSFIVKLQLEIGIEMKIKPIDYFAKKIRICCELEEQIEDADFLIKFERENNIKFSRCVIERNESGLDDSKIFLGITPLCLKQINDKDNLILINQRLKVINVLENPYPELFSDQQ